jgi:hypothetical protein
MAWDRGQWSRHKAAAEKRFLARGLGPPELASLLASLDARSCGGGMGGVEPRLVVGLGTCPGLVPLFVCAASSGLLGGGGF